MRDPGERFAEDVAALAAMADPYAYRQYIAGALPDPPASPFVPADPSAAAARDTSLAAAGDASPDRTLPAIPDWVQYPAKWVTLSRADRRALERHHRKQQQR